MKDITVEVSTEKCLTEIIENGMLVDAIEYLIEYADKNELQQIRKLL